MLNGVAGALIGAIKFATRNRATQAEIDRMKAENERLKAGGTQAGGGSAGSGAGSAPGGDTSSKLDAQDEREKRLQAIMGTLSGTPAGGAAGAPPGKIKIDRGAPNRRGIYPYDIYGHGPTPRFQHEQLMDELSQLRAQNPNYFHPSVAVVPRDWIGTLPKWDDGTPMTFEDLINVAPDPGPMLTAAQIRKMQNQANTGAGGGSPTRGTGGGSGGGGFTTMPNLVPGQIPTLQQLQQMNQNVVGGKIPSTQTSGGRRPRR